MKRRLSFSFFGSSLVSAYWNGAATYYRGILRALAARGHKITFYEPDAYDRQKHRDIEDPDWARVVVYSGTDESDVRRVLEMAEGSDVVVKASGVGVWDRLLEDAIAGFPSPSRRIFWDVDAPATLSRVEDDPRDPFASLIPRFDVVFTYGGGDPVVRRYQRLGARVCLPIYNALDPDTHHPAPARAELAADLGLLANRLPDREARVEEYFFRAARLLPDRTFLLGGNGWGDKDLPPNVRWIGHVYTGDHNAFNASCTAVLNVARDSMADNGFSPATRVFEAAGAGACIVTDAWDGIELFLQPDEEILVAHDGAEVAAILRTLDRKRAQAIGERARSRVLAQHTYRQRAREVELQLLPESQGLSLSVP
jgi:spore maturation protein CgeB